MNCRAQVSLKECTYVHTCLFHCTSSVSNVLFVCRADCFNSFLLCTSHLGTNKLTFNSVLKSDLCQPSYKGNLCTHTVEYYFIMYFRSKVLILLESRTKLHLISKTFPPLLPYLTIQNFIQTGKRVLLLNFLLALFATCYLPTYIQYSTV